MRRFRGCILCRIDVDHYSPVEGNGNSKASVAKPLSRSLSFFLLATFLFTGAVFGRHERPRTRFVVQVGNKYGYIDRSGRVVIPPKYGLAWNFTEGLASVSLITRPGYIGKAGFINEMGKLVIPMRFQYAREFEEERAEVELNDKWGFIDRKGRFVIKPRYDEVHSFNEGIAAVQLGGEWGFIDKYGRQIIPPQYTLAWGFSEGLSGVYYGGKCGFIDRRNEIVIGFHFNECRGFAQDGPAPVRVGDKWAYINKKGGFVVPPTFENAWPFSEGLAPVKLHGKWGYIDPSGKVIIPLQFEDSGLYVKSIGTFRERMAAVKIGSKWGFISREGKVVIHPRFVKASGFHNGIAEVWDPKCAYIDTSGNTIWTSNPKARAP